MQQPSIGLRQLEHLGGFEPSILNRPELANRWAQKSGRKVRFFDSTEGVSAFGTSISTPKGVSEAPNFPFKTKGLPIVWWRWRESNPRPKAIDARYYMLSSPLDLVPRQHSVQSASKDQPA